MENYLEGFPTSESARKMLGYVSDGFYDSSYVGKWLYQVMGTEYDMALNIVESLPAQLFPETATWGLMYHEIKWGLPVRENLTFEERRRLIYQKRDCRSPLTPYRMEKYLENATGFGVHIADINDTGKYGFIAPHPNAFKAFFIGDGTLDTKQVREILNRLKQSHTIYTINDRIEIVLDNKDLEQIVLRNIRFRLCIPFWYTSNGCKVLDGTWLLDGTILLNSERNYDLRLYMKCYIGKIRTQLISGIMKRLCIRLKQNKEDAIVNRQIEICCRVKTGTKSRTKTCVAFRMNLVRECFAGAAVIQRRNLWYLDGTYNLDGTRFLNAEYKEEEI